MNTNILKSIINIKNLKSLDLEKIYPSNSPVSNRINQVGVKLEFFIKDSYCNSFHEEDKHNLHEKAFSWLGNKNNPPDIILKNGDAIEVKKTENKNYISLNSSYPKSKLNVNDERICKSCREAEEWHEKDIIYSIGIVEQNILKNLFLVYGDLYAANHDIYDNIFKNVQNAIIKSNLEFSNTKEIGRINRVDPLGITYLRVRGMWGIGHPLNVYNYLLKENSQNNFSLFCLMNRKKYDSFPNEDIELIENDDYIVLEDVKVKDPNNPAKFIDSILVRYDRS